MKSPTIEGARWVGRLLRDKWRIDARIARGGVGTVFAATHKNNGNRVAIKVLHPEFSRDEDTRSRFLQEGYAANQVNHPGVVRILDDDTTDEGAAFLVMELLDGEPLEARRVRMGGTVPLREVYEIAEQLLDVLAAAHDKGIVHRDIKPDNLFVTHDGRLKVLDFGFAQMKTGVRREQTATGFLLGTPGFMSPEQSVGNRAQVDAQTDIWAVGATLFFLLSGHPVHEGESAAEMLVAAANFAPRSLAAVASGLPPRLVQIVDKALAFDKSARWPSARAMHSALRSIPGHPDAHPAPESRRRSSPDVAPMSEDRTVYAPGQAVEQRDSADLIEAAPSWMSPDRTAMLAGHRPQVAATPNRSLSAITAMEEHPADQDLATLARPSPRSESYPSLVDDSPPPIQRDPSSPPAESTIIMEGSPAAPATAAWSGAYAGMDRAPIPTPIAAAPFGRASYPAVAPATQPFPAPRPSQPELYPTPRPSQPELYPTPRPSQHELYPTPRPSQPELYPTPRPSQHELHPAGEPGLPGSPLVDPAGHAPHAGRSGSQALVLVAVALVSMTIVVVTGLLLFAAMD